MMTSSNGNIFRVTGHLCGESPVNSPDKGLWRGALMFSLICTRINCWVNNHETGDVRRHQAHCDVIVMVNPINTVSNMTLEHLQTIFICMRQASETQCYNVTPSLIGWAHIQNHPCVSVYQKYHNAMQTSPNSAFCSTHFRYFTETGEGNFTKQCHKCSEPSLFTVERARYLALSGWLFLCVIIS